MSINYCSPFRKEAGTHWGLGGSFFFVAVLWYYMSHYSPLPHHTITPLSPQKIRKYAAKVYSPIETFWCREENKFFIQGLKTNTTADQKVSEGENGAYWLHQWLLVQLVSRILFVEAPSDLTGPVSLFLFAINSHKMGIWKLLQLKWLRYRETEREWTGLWVVVTYLLVFRYYGLKSKFRVLAECFVVVMHQAPVIIRDVERINEWPSVLLKITLHPCNKLRWNFFGRES